MQAMVVVSSLAAAAVNNATEKAKHLASLETCATGDNMHDKGCVRATILAVMAATALVLALVVAARKGAWGTKFSPQMFILWLAIFQLTLISVHYTFYRQVAMAFAQRTLCTLEFVLICYFACVVACRVLRRRPLIKTVVSPVALVAVVFVVGVFVVTLAVSHNKTIHCTDSAWLALAVANGLVALVFAFVGFLITRNADSRALADFRMKKSRRLWLLVIVNVVCAALVLAWDIGVAVGNSGIDCDNFITGDNVGSTFAYVLHRALTTLMPPSAVVCVVWSLPRQASPHAGAELRRATDPMHQPMLDADVEVDELTVLQAWKEALLYHDDDPSVHSLPSSPPHLVPSPSRLAHPALP